MKILQYIHGNFNCNRLSRVLNRKYDLETVTEAETFLHVARKCNINAGILCYCYANNEEIKDLLKLQTEIITVPIVVCTKFLNPEFIRTGVHKGLDHFILCSMPHRQINSKIIEAIQQNDFRLFLENEANPDVYTPYTQDIITEILSTSPNQLKISSLAEKLGISVRWTQSLIQRIFNRSFTQLKRKLIVLQALNLMKNTRLDNIEIALMLGYRHESSLFKAFQKELGYPPSQARENLSKANPQKLLK